MNFIDHYLYYLSIPFLALIIFIFFKLKRAIVNNHSLVKVVTLTFGLTLFGLQLSLIPMYTLQGRMQHIFLTDLCPFSAFTLGIAMIIGKEKWIKMITIWGLLGATLTIATSSPDMVQEGIASGLVSYLRHIFLFTAFFWNLINFKKGYEKADVIMVYIYIAVFIGWILIAAGIPYWVTGDERWGVFSTGMLKPSWHEATIQYHKHGIQEVETVGDYAFFASFGMPYPITTILFYALSCLIIFALLTLVNIYMKKTKVKADTSLEESNWIWKRG